MLCGARPASTITQQRTPTNSTHHQIARFTTYQPNGTHQPIPSTTIRQPIPSTAAQQKLTARRPLIRACIRCIPSNLFPIVSSRLPHISSSQAPSASPQQYINHGVTAQRPQGSMPAKALQHMCHASVPLKFQWAHGHEMLNHFVRGLLAPLLVILEQRQYSVNQLLLDLPCQHPPCSKETRLRWR